MIGKVYDGGKTGMNAILFGVSSMYNPNDSVIINDFTNRSVLTNTSEYFNTAVQTMNSIYHSDDVINLSKQLIMKHGNVLNPNTMMLISKDNIASSNLMMQTVIMSHPEVVRLNNLGVIDGFNNVTIDTDLHKFVDSGNVSITDNGIEYSTYYNSAYDEYTELDKDCIINCWETINDLLAEGLDPTSKELIPY